jgi:hypothetical protein
MKLTTIILAIAVMAGGAWAQNPDAIDNARSVAKSLQQKQANDTNAALDAAGIPAKPAPGQATTTPAGQKPAPAAFVPAKSAMKPVFASAPPVSATPKPTIKRANGAKKSPVDAAARASKSKAKKMKIAAATEINPAPDARATDASKSVDASKQPQPEEKKWAMSGKRDPFFSPVVQQAGGSGCSTGKKCLEIGHINVRGVVKSDTGFIAVVTNDLNKAYFLRENDPVFNGYVVRITGDSVVFQETVQDKLGKPFTREVTKRIFTPAV